jgi:hypothetical protein
MAEKLATPARRDGDISAEQRFVWQTHPLYQAWYPTWRLLGEVYEGDGGFLDGSNLVPHPRELVYSKLANGDIDTTKPPVEKDKFKRRKALARYENFAQAMVDLFVDHQYTKGIVRSFAGAKDAASAAKEPIAEWWKDVDGLGTNIDEWLKQTQVMADVFGHVFVVMDREQPQDFTPKTAAEEGPLVLRVYTPLDALDWLAPHRKLTAIKFIEAIERKTLQESSTFAADANGGAGLDPQRGTAAIPNVQYRVWTGTDWTVYAKDGTRSGGGPHAFGELPIMTFYAKRRPRIPVIGRSLLRDPKLFKDHFNLISELRELLRGQTFAMLHITLAENESVDDARGRLGDHAGIDTIIWSKGEANFIAAPGGPADTYMKEIAQVEAKMFRLSGVGGDTDSHVAESEGSRRIKAMDLNRLLAGHAAEAQRLDIALNRKWYIGTYGKDQGLKKWTDARLSIVHPSEFYVEELEQTISDTLESLELPMGETFSRLIRERAVPRVLPMIDEEDLDTITQEIGALVKQEQADKVAQQAALQAAADAVTNVRLDAAGRPQPKLDAGAVPAAPGAKPLVKKKAGKGKLATPKAAPGATV